MGHARLSPSKSGRVLVCAASVNREAALPDEPGGPAANQGTNAHWLLEQCIIEDRCPPGVYGDGGNGFLAQLPYTADGLPHELLDQAYNCYHYVKQRKEALGEGTQLLPEAKVDPMLYTGRNDSPGTVDAILVSGDLRTVEIVDLKTGGSLVEADASQLKLYALGVMAQYASPDGSVPFDTIRLTVFQPKRPGEETVERFVDFTPADLIQWAHGTWVPAAVASDDPNAPANPTDEGCKYCKAKKHGTCAEYKAAIQGVAVQLFGPVDTPTFSGAVINPALPNATDALLSEFAVKQMTPEQVGAFLDIWPLVKARGKDIEEHAINMLKARVAIPGHKLVEGRKTNAWAHDDEEQAKKFKNAKLTLDDIYLRKLRSPAQMRDMRLPPNKWASVKKHIITKPGGLTLAPEDDSRPNAMPAIAFAPVDQVAQQTLEAPKAEVVETPALDMSFLNV